VTETQTGCEREHAYWIVGEFGTLGAELHTPGQALARFRWSGPAAREIYVVHLNSTACPAEQQRLAAAVAELAAARGGAR
jgi:hypothetical protein